MKMLQQNNLSAEGADMSRDNPAETAAPWVYFFFFLGI